MTSLLPIFLLCSFAIVLPSEALGSIQVLDIALTRNVQDREPLGQYKPTAFCEKDQARFGQIPTINLSIDHSVIFWNKIASTEAQTLRHAWHKKTEEGWTSVAQIDIKIAKSQSYRIWSSKDLRANLHQGEWMIVVSLAEDQKHILCISRFLAQ